MPGEDSLFEDDNEQNQQHHADYSAEYIRDPQASLYGRVELYHIRPKKWHCIYCGWRCEEWFNDYICKNCDAIRPFSGDSATMLRCEKCHHYSLGIAMFCEWCGNLFGSEL